LNASYGEQFPAGSASDGKLGLLIWLSRFELMSKTG
jgi:hypothetical protein